MLPDEKCIKGLTLKEILLSCSVHVALITSRILVSLLIDDISDSLG